MYAKSVFQPNALGTDRMYWQVSDFHKGAVPGFGRVEIYLLISFFCVRYVPNTILLPCMCVCMYVCFMCYFLTGPIFDHFYIKFYIIFNIIYLC